MSKKIVKCSVCGFNTALYKVERVNGHKRYVCSKHPKKEAVMRKQTQFEKDLEFYTWIWKNRDHYCQECGAKLHQFSIDQFHHILGKRKYPYFRHEPKNIVLLCGKFGCHAKAESAVSYPKMKIFPYTEKIKAELLESVGLTYHTPKS